MQTLTEAYEEVQRRKEESSFDEWPAAWAPVVTEIAAGLKRQLDTTDPRVLEVTLDGMAWVVRMLHEEGLNAEEAMRVPERLVENVLGNMPPRFPLALMRPEQCVELGVGAGFYTGLWMGLLMDPREERPVDSPTHA